MLAGLVSVLQRLQHHPLPRRGACGKSCKLSLACDEGRFLDFGILWPIQQSDKEFRHTLQVQQLSPTLTTVLVKVRTSCRPAHPSKVTSRLRVQFNATPRRSRVLRSLEPIRLHPPFSAPALGFFVFLRPERNPPSGGSTSTFDASCSSGWSVGSDLSSLRPAHYSRSPSVAFARLLSSRILAQDCVAARDG